MGQGADRRPLVGQELEADGLASVRLVEARPLEAAKGHLLSWYLQDQARQGGGKRGSRGDPAARQRQVRGDARHAVEPGAQGDREADAGPPPGGGARRCGPWGSPGSRPRAARTGPGWPTGWTAAGQRRTGSPATAAAIPGRAATARAAAA